MYVTGDPLSYLTNARPMQDTVLDTAKATKDQTPTNKRRASLREVNAHLNAPGKRSSTVDVGRHKD